MPTKDGRRLRTHDWPFDSDRAAFPRPPIDRQQPAAAQEDRAVGEAVDRFEIVGREQDDAAGAAQIGKPRAKRARRGIVQAGERLVEQHEPRLVQQRALEREPLTHPARKSSDRIVAAVQAGALERGCHRAIDVGDAIGAGKEREILGRRQLRVDEQVVAEDADARAQLGARRGGASP